MTQRQEVVKTLPFPPLYKTTLIHTLHHTLHSLQPLALLLFLHPALTPFPLSYPSTFSTLTFPSSGHHSLLVTNTSTPFTTFPSPHSLQPFPSPHFLRFLLLATFPSLPSLHHIPFTPFPSPHSLHNSPHSIHSLLFPKFPSLIPFTPLSSSHSLHPIIPSSRIHLPFFSQSFLSQFIQLLSLYALHFFSPPPIQFLFPFYNLRTIMSHGLDLKHLPLPPPNN